MALVPQPPPVRPTTPPGGPAPLDDFWLGVAAATLAVASAIAAFCKELAARWRGVVVAHLFFLTLWLAIQVFFFATGAYWCIPANGSRFARWLTMSFTHVARCGPAVQVISLPFQGPTISVASPQPPPQKSSTAPPPPPQTPPLAAPPPAADGPPAAPPRAATGWSARSIANCWRNRAIGGSDCYAAADQHRGPPPPRYRYPYPQRPPPARHPCRNSYDCWPGYFRRGDDL